MIHTKISLSEQVDSVTPWAQLLYTWAVPHGDDAGILPRRAKVLKAKVFPLKELTSDEVEALIKALIDVKLFQQVEIDGVEYLWIVNFWKHQTLQKDRNPKVVFEYNAHDIPDTSGMPSKERYKTLKDTYRANWALIEEVVDGFQVDSKEKKKPPVSRAPTKPKKPKVPKQKKETSDHVGVKDINDLKELSAHFDKDYSKIRPEVWKTWNEYCAEKGKTGKKRPLTTIKFQLARLLKSKNHAKMVSYTIENGWEGLYDPEDKKSTTGDSTGSMNGGQMSDRERRIRKREQAEKDERIRAENAKNNEGLRKIEEMKAKVLSGKTLGD